MMDEFYFYWWGFYGKVSRFFRVFIRDFDVFFNRGDVGWSYPKGIYRVVCMIFTKLIKGEIRTVYVSASEKMKELIKDGWKMETTTGIEIGVLQ